jgi:hypothetical protein
MGHFKASEIDFCKNLIYSSARALDHPQSATIALGVKSYFKVVAEQRMEHSWWVIIPWQLAVLGLAGWGAFKIARRLTAQLSVADSQSFPSAQQARSKTPLQVRLVCNSADVDDFCSKLLSQTPNAMAFGDPDAFSYPCYVVAIPDEGLSFDARPIAFDPLSEMADLEARILTQASAHLQSQPTSKASIKPRRL